MKGFTDDHLAKESAVRDLVRHHLDKALGELASWEQIRRFAVLAQPFTTEAGEMTVSLKLRRGVVLERYKEVINRLYEAGEE